MTSGTCVYSSILAGVLSMPTTSIPGGTLSCSFQPSHGAEGSKRFWPSSAYKAVVIARDARERCIRGDEEVPALHRERPAVLRGVLLHRLLDIRAQSGEHLVEECNARLRIGRSFSLPAVLGRRTAGPSRAASSVRLVRSARGR